MRPHRRQLTRLPRPWDSPGKNTGVGCHFLLQCIKVKVKSLSRVWLLATPWTAAYQAPPSTGFSRQEYWSGVPLAFSEILTLQFPNIIYLMLVTSLLGFPGGSEVKASACNAGDLGSIPGLGRSPGEGNGTLLQYSCLENPMDGGAWWATVHGVAKSQTWLSDFTFTFTSLLMMVHPLCHYEYWLPVTKIITLFHR